ncbi:dUTP diphosphatase [Roseibium aggregatum]|uniref:dUTP diphosphatase n=1 Tax=Roseibium aggregatum TaxID=187304 RepID=A0A0M6Y6F1_9HYPH|nr:dUTP diphosphatase [Roseibium aggregatum]CTQ45675.1 Deoxyuridine 5'-triphosphate nucleotidohydrolase [Roseibium aggregatum]
MKLPIKYLDGYSPDWPRLEYAKEGDAGFDLRSTASLRIRSGGIVTVPVGVAFEIPEGYELQIRGRSGLAFKHHVFLIHSPGTIDSGFRGEIRVMLKNEGSKDLRIEPGDRVAQAVLAKFEQAEFVTVETLSESARGETGFGSSGMS